MVNEAARLAMTNPTCLQFNFSTSLGGAEIYTQLFNKALLAMGWKTVVYVNSRATFWRELNMSGIELVPIDRREDLPAHLPRQRSLIVAHTPLNREAATRIAQTHLLAAIVHHPIYGGNGEPYRACTILLPVSQHVIDTLKAAGLAHYHPEPLYGAVDPARLSPTGAPLCATPLYDWDKRKLRDRLLRRIYPLYWKLKPARYFKRREGLTLGIVSRIADAKQFPALFRILAPVIARHPQVHVEIFGSGVGYAAIKHLKRELRGIERQVRFWGPQTDLGQIYRGMDFLLAGLPEREAMGLNILEAQFCGTPVLAVNARPFSEIIQDGATGHLYADPRQDKGAALEALLDKLLTSPEHPRPLDHAGFLDAFSFEAFARRADRILSAIWNNSEATQP